jgi:hypothetical protein
MKGIRSLPILGLLLLAGSVFGPAAHAQQVDASGTFVLPYQVQWQGGTLPAGKYSFTVESGSMGDSNLAFVRGPRGGHARLIAAALATGGFKGKSSLLIVTVNGKQYVRSLRLGKIGTEIEYWVPKAKSGNIREASVKAISVQTVGE